MIPIAIIGARLYYVIFQWGDYREHPIDALKIWEGGLAIYGGVIAGLLTGIVWCRKKKIPFWRDGGRVCAACSSASASAAGATSSTARPSAARRPPSPAWGSRSPAGRPCTYIRRFCMRACGTSWAFCCCTSRFRKHERKFYGELILLYAVWYGIGRALIEGLRTDSLYITGTGIRVSQLLAGVSAAAAAVVLALFYTGKLRHAPRYVDRGEQPNA